MKCVLQRVTCLRRFLRSERLSVWLFAVSWGGVRMPVCLWAVSWGGVRMPVCLWAVSWGGVRMSVCLWAVSCVTQPTLPPTPNIPQSVGSAASTLLSALALITFNMWSFKRLKPQNDPLGMEGTTCQQNTGPDKNKAVISTALNIYNSWLDK